VINTTASKTKKIGTLTSYGSTASYQNITQNNQQRNKRISFDQTNKTMML